MVSAAPLTPDDRFAAIIDGLCKAVAASLGRGGMTGPLIILIWSRLRRMATRFTRLAARVRAGKPSVARRRPASSRPARPRPPRLPNRFAWLPGLVPPAAAYGSQLQYLLMDPQMAALIAAAPQAGRILRPLCRMLGVRPPPILTANLLRPRPAPRGAPSRPAASGPAPAPAQPPGQPSAPAPDPRACGPPDNVA